MELIVGDIIEAEVSDFGSEGEGVVKVDGCPVFIPFAIKGETIRARIVSARRDVAFGELIEVLKPSPRRVKPVCPYFGKCGGCDMQHIDRELQLEIKTNAVKKAFKKIAGLDVAPALPLRFDDYGYRNKLSLPFGTNKKSGRVYVGFYEKRTHKIVPIKFCPISGDWAGDLIEIVTAWANKHAISTYDEGARKGLLRHLVARNLTSLCLTLVVNGGDIPHFDELASAVAQRFNGAQIYISQNSSAGNVIMGDNARLVYGSRQKQKLGRLEAEISPLSFLQVNDKIRDALYDSAAELCDGENDIVELYSGAGLLTAEIALRLKTAKITSVEIVKQAVDDAVRLFESLNISDRITAVADDAANYVSHIKSGRGKTLLLDPPRRGCDKDALLKMAAANFDKIVYISCNPQTLARDVGLICEFYSVEYIKLFDMFPQTANLETLVLLSRKNH